MEGQTLIRICISFRSCRCRIFSDATGKVRGKAWEQEQGEERRGEERRGEEMRRAEVITTWWRVCVCTSSGEHLTSQKVQFFSCADAAQTDTVAPAFPSLSDMTDMRAISSTFFPCERSVFFCVPVSRFPKGLRTLKTAKTCDFLTFVASVRGSLHIISPVGTRTKVALTALSAQQDLCQEHYSSICAHLSSFSILLNTTEN